MLGPVARATAFGDHDSVEIRVDSARAGRSVRAAGHPAMPNDTGQGAGRRTGEIEMRVAIGSDHAGFELKETLKAFLAGKHEEVLDVGTHTREAVDYARLRGGRRRRLARTPRRSRDHPVRQRRRRLDGGQPHPGIRAGLCHDTYSAHQGVEHDDMNVLVLGGRVVGSELARELVDAFLNATFSGEARHLRRLAKVTALESPVRALQVFGQSVWLDYIRRSLITSGELQRLIEEDGVRGVTSNPAIFEKAIAGSSDYADLLDAPGAASIDATALREAGDPGYPGRRRSAPRRYDETNRRDGYVSLEVSPLLAFDTAGTLAEARRLWAAVGRAEPDDQGHRPPRGHHGLPAADRGRHQRQRDAALRAGGLRARCRGVHRRARSAGRAGRRSGRGRQRGQLLRQPDRYGDRRPDRRPAAESRRCARQQGCFQSLRGKVAIANAKLAFQRYQELFGSPRWRALAARGAQTQRLLWASTGTKNASYRDVVYVEELIGPDTVNTIPPPTLTAFRDHGRPRASLTEDLDGAWDTMHAGRDRHLAESDHRCAADRGHSAVRRRVPQAAGGRGGAESRDRSHAHPTALRPRPAAGVRDGSQGVARRLAGAREGEAALGARRDVVDRPR